MSSLLFAVLVATSVHMIQESPQRWRNASGMSYLPMQNWLNTLSNTSSVTSSPLISPSAATADLRSMVQKSIGRPSLMLSVTASKASCARIKALPVCYSQPSLHRLHTPSHGQCAKCTTLLQCCLQSAQCTYQCIIHQGQISMYVHIVSYHVRQQAKTYAAGATCS